MLEFGVLGPVQVVRDGRPLALGGTKQRALLAILLLNANELLSRDRLIDALWGERAPPTASHTLETYVHRLRRILQAGEEEVILTRPGGYLFRLDPDALDLSRFERLLDDGRSRTEADAPERAAAKLREALSLWRGRPLADVEYEPWAAEHVVRLEEMRLDALEERIEADLAAGASRELVGELEALIAAHPLRERPRGQLMRALYRLGRQAEALEVYREGRRVLLDELGIEPGPVLQELQRAILVQERGLGVPSAGRAPEWVAAKGGAYTTSFIGRRRERRELGRLLRTVEARLVVLTGPGGIGKTRLALELAAKLAPRFRHGSVVVDLVPVMDPEAVLPAIAARLGLGESRGRSVLDALAGFLEGRETLLVLDNFEHVHAAAPMLGELLARTDGATFLVTSRAPLRLSGEHVYLVPPLELPDAAQHLALDRLKQFEAVRLFVERAMRARADFELSVVNADGVAELCVRLDGLPLALELAAARVRLLSPQAIVGRLGRRLDLLKSEAPDAPERHRTLRAAIEWSYDLLSKAEQTLFACLGVFTGGFTLDGAEAVVTGLGLDALDGVESLLDNNLLRPLPTAGGEPRFGMLETIREYAAERLATLADAPEVHRRHSLYYLAVAVDAEPQLRGPRQLAWLERLDADNDNLRAALDWATDNGEVEPGLRGAAGLWRYWQTRSLNSEGRERLERLLALDVENLSPIVLADASAAAGRLAYILGDYEYARSYLDKGLSVHRAAATTPWASHTATVLGLIALARGDNDTALGLVEDSVAVARSSHDWWAQSQGLGAMGEVLRARNEFGRARLALEESLRATRECGDLRNIGRILSVLGLVALAQCDHERASRLFEEGLAVQRDCGDAWNVSRSLANLGLVARDAGDRTEAKRRFAEAVTMQVETNDREGIATTLSLLAELAVADGRTRRAVRVLSAAQMLRDEVGFFPQNQLRRAEVDVEALRAQIGQDAFDAAWAGGRSLMLNEAVAYALEDDAGAPDPEPAQPVSQPSAAGL